MIFAIAQETLQSRITQQNADAIAALRGGVKSGNNRRRGNR